MQKKKRQHSVDDALRNLHEKGKIMDFTILIGDEDKVFISKQIVSSRMVPFSSEQILALKIVPKHMHTSPVMLNKSRIHGYCNPTQTNLHLQTGQEIY